MTYTHTPIHGKLPQRTLPDGCALVLEGGGTRGFYSAGVFEAFMDARIMFPYIVGVSAGAANVLSYVAGQPGRNREVVEHYVGDHRYLSKRNLLLHRSMFNMEFVFRTVPMRHIFLDWDIINQADVRLLTGAIDCDSGKTVWFEKSDLDERLDATVASCSMPILSPIAKLGRARLLDGGVADAIPIEKSIADGNDRHVIVLTRNAEYRKTPEKYSKAFKLYYRRYPKLVEALLTRHDTYNRQLDLCHELEAQGRAVIIRPLEPLQVGRTGDDIPKLLELYDEGHSEGTRAMQTIYKLCDYCPGTLL